MKHLGDITKIKGSDVPLVDIVCGGSPCQDLSIAGRREGLSGERSGLFMEQIRIIKEMRERDKSNRGTDVDIRFLRPRFMVWENVPGAFSSNNGEDFRVVLEETAKVAERNASIPRFEGRWPQSGCIMGNGWSIAWRVHDAQFWGVPQRRKRIALVADFGGATAPEILFERQGVSGNTEESREEGENTSQNAQRGIGETISYCIRNGQVHDAMTPSPVCKTLNTMDDSMKIMTVSQDAYDKFSENDKSASLKASGGTYGGERSSCNTIGSLCARDYKGVGSQYVTE